MKGLLGASASGVAQAKVYPLTVTDLAGRSVTIAAPPARIALLDGNDAMTLALLDQEAPFKRVVMWNNNLATSDPSLWALMRQASRSPALAP